MNCDMIQHSMTLCDIEKNSFMFSHDSPLHRTHEWIESLIHLKTQLGLEIQMKDKVK